MYRRSSLDTNIKQQQNMGRAVTALCMTSLEATSANASTKIKTSKFDPGDSTSYFAKF